jgi:lipoprotein-anchoring transpeptidase ErfK/SrfK
MRKSLLRVLVVLWSSVSAVACNAGPAPPEVRTAEVLEKSLWRAGAPDADPFAYRRFLSSLGRAKDNFIVQRGRFPLWRDYDSVRREYAVVLVEGTRLLKAVREEKRLKLEDFERQYAAAEARLLALEKLTAGMNEGRLAGTDMSKAQILMAEAQALKLREKYDQATAMMFDINFNLRRAQAALSPIIERYTDKRQLARWKQLVEEAVGESRSNGRVVIVVDKAGRSMVIYRSGRPWKSYEVGLGRNGLTDKLYSGDYATPEGKYRVIKKIPSSQFGRGLLINYPNDEDHRQYVSAKNKGLIPPRVGIGGELEIHGGGKEGMTYGCIALDDDEMEEVYGLIDIGTPVTIVGAANEDNFISAIIDEF